MSEYDVVIVGGGGSGLAAAVSAAQQGLSVLLLEKRSELGGTTGIAVGSFTASGTRLQRAARIDDNPSDHSADAARFAPPEIEARNNAAQRGFFLAHASETLDWLTEMGVRFHGPFPEPPNRNPRMHNVVPNAKAYVAILHARFLALGGRIWCSARATRLLGTAERVEGVQVRVAADDVSVRAKVGVVLASGDYASNSQLIAAYKGEQFRTIEGINPHATGDGHLLAQQVGACLSNMDVTYGPELRFVPPPRRAFVQLLPASGPLARCAAMLLPWLPEVVLTRMIKRLLVTWQHPENKLFDDGAILINRDGERFCCELNSPEREIAVSRQPEKLAYLLMDERLTERYSRWPHFISTAPEIAYAYVQDYLRLRPDVAISGSLELIARTVNLPLAVLQEAIQSANAGRNSGQPPEPLRGDRWTLLGPAKAYFTTTEGGVDCDQQFRVLDANRIPIPGLYAVGQVGLAGQILWGHGLHVAWAMTSGRLAGKVLAQSRQVKPRS